MTSSASMAKHMILGQLYTNEITDPRLLQAMTDVPRERFLPKSLSGAAYVDEDLPLGNDRFLIEPLTLAKLIDLADITDGSRVLVIGAVNGYPAAVAAKLAGQVVAIDSDATMLEEARTHLTALGMTNVDLETVKNLSDGYTPSAPYDAIIIAGAVASIPDSLAMQLALHGKLVAVRNIAARPGSKHGLGKGVLVTRVGAQLEYEERFDTATALLPGFESKQAFTF